MQAWLASLEGDGRSWATRARMEREKEHIADRRMCKDRPCINYWSIIHEFGPPVVTEYANGTPLAAPWSTDVTLYNRTGTLPIPFVISLAGPQRLKAFRDHSCGQCRITGVFLGAWDRLNPNHVVTRDRQNQVISQPHDYARFQYNLERWWKGSVQTPNGVLDRLTQFKSILPNNELVMDPDFAMRPIAKQREEGTKESERQFELPAQHFWQTDTPKGAASYWSRLTALTLAIEERLVWAFSSHPNGATSPRHPARTPYHNRGDGFGMDGRFAIGVEVWRRFKPDLDLTSQNHSVMWKVDVFAAAPALNDRLKITIFVTNFATNKARVGLQGSERALGVFTGFFLEFILGPVLNMSSDALASAGYTRKEALVTLTDVFVNSFGPGMNAIWAAEAPPHRRPRLAQAAAPASDAPLSARPRLAPLAQASPRPLTVTQPVTRLTAADVPRLDLTSLTTAKDAALAAAFQRVLANSRTARGETGDDSDAETDVPDVTQAKLEAAYARIELIQRWMLKDEQLARELQAVEDAEAEAQRQHAEARAAARRQQYGSGGSSTEAGIPAAPRAAGQAPEAGTPAANPAAGQASRTVPSAPAAAAGPESAATPAARSRPPDPIGGLWPPGRIDPPVTPPVPSDHAIAQAVGLAQHLPRKAAQALLAQAGQPVPTEPAPAAPVSPQPAAPAPQSQWNEPGLMGDTTYTSGSDSHSTGAPTPRRNSDGSFARTKGGWDDDVYRKGKGKGTGIGDPSNSPRPQRRGAASAQPGDRRGRSPIRRAEHWPVHNSFRKDEDDWGQSWRSARPTLPSPARPPPDQPEAEPPAPPQPAQPSPIPPPPPPQPRQPKPVDPEVVRQFVAPSLDEMLVADMAAREDAEAGFDQRNDATFNTQHYQTVVPRHLITWGEPGVECPRNESNELVTRLDTTISIHVLPERRRALPLSPREWVCKAAVDPNHPATGFDATTVPYLLKLAVPRGGTQVTVIDGDLNHDETSRHFGNDTVTPQEPLQTRVPTSRQLDYVGTIVPHPDARWNRVGDGRAHGSDNSSYVMWLANDQTNWLGALMRPGEIIRLHITGIAPPERWPEWPGNKFDEWRRLSGGAWERMPWTKPVLRHPKGFPRIDSYADFWAQKERGFVTLRVTQDPKAEVAGNPQRLAFIGLEPPKARPKCKEAIAAQGECECLHCRLQDVSMLLLSFLVGLHLAVVYRLEIGDVPVTLEGGTLEQLQQQYKVDDKDRGAYRRKVTPAPVRRRSRSRSRSQSRAAARRRSRSREWRYPTDPDAAGGGVPTARLHPSRPRSKIDFALTEEMRHSGTTGLRRAGLTHIAEAKTKELLQDSTDPRRVRLGPGDLRAPGQVLPAQQVSAGLDLIAAYKGDGETPAQFKPTLRDVTQIPDEQLSWPAEVRGRENSRWKKWKKFCHPWNQKWSTNFRTQRDRYVEDWDSLCTPCGPGQEFKDDRGECGAGYWRGGTYLYCGMSHLCNFCVCPKDESGCPVAGYCQGISVVDSRGHTHHCCTARDTCHGMWTHLGLTPDGDEIRYPLYQEALAAQQAHVAKQAAARAAPAPSEEELQAQAQNLLTAMHQPPAVDQTPLTREEETALLRSCLGVGCHPAAEASPTIVHYNPTTANELADEALNIVKRLATDADMAGQGTPSPADVPATTPPPVDPSLPTAQLTDEQLLSLVPRDAVTPADEGTHRKEVALSDAGEPEPAASPADRVVSEEPWYNQVKYKEEHLDLTDEEKQRHSTHTLARRFQAVDYLFAQMSKVQRQWVTVARVRGGPADLAVNLAEYAARKGLVSAADAANGWHAAEELDSLKSLELTHFETISQFQERWRSYKRNAGFHWTWERRNEEGRLSRLAIMLNKIWRVTSTGDLNWLIPKPSWVGVTPS